MQVYSFTGQQETPAILAHCLHVRAHGRQREEERKPSVPCVGLSNEILDKGY